MPRRKAVDRDKPHKTRTRTGCLTCRKRKIRCDGGLPTCENCAARSLECERGIKLKWQADYATHGLAFGRAGVWSKSGDAADAFPSLGETDVPWVPVPMIEHYHFVMDDFEEDNNIFAASSRRASLDSSFSHEEAAVDLAERSVAKLRPKLRPPAINLTMPIYRHTSMELNDSTTSSHLLRYYTDVLCPLTIASRGGPSPFSDLILPFAFCASPLALDAILALAAQHMSRMHDHVASLPDLLVSKVLRSLRHEFASKSPTVLAQNPEISLVMVLLCLYEIAGDCNERWVVHLRGAKDLIRARRQLMIHDRTQAEDALITFSDRFFANQDIIGRTACGEAPLFGADYWDATDNAVDSCLGCSPRLMSLICQIAELSRTKDKVDSLTFDEDIRALETSLSMLHQDATMFDDPCLELVASIKQTAASVYLHCALYGAKPESLLIRESIAELLHQIGAVLDEGSSAGLLWPLFVTAVELDAEACSNIDDPQFYGRRTVLNYLERISNGSMANINRTREVICHVWQARDMEVDAVVDDRTCDWDRFVAPFSTHISLV